MTLDHWRLLSMACDRFRHEVKAGPWNVVLAELVGVLDSLDAKEGAAQDDGRQQVKDQQFLLAGLCGIYRQNNCEAAANQHRGINRAESNAKALAGGCKVVEVGQAIDEIGAKHTAEKHDLGHQEEPHSEAGRVLLLLRIGKMMPQLR